MRLDKEERKIIKELCDKYNLSQNQVLDIVKAPFRFIRETTASIDVNPDWTEEEFTKNTYNFNIPSIGKLYARYHNLKMLNYAKERKHRKSSSEIQGGEEDR